MEHLQEGGRFTGGVGAQLSGVLLQQAPDTPPVHRHPGGGAGVGGGAPGGGGGGGCGR